MLNVLKKRGALGATVATAWVVVILGLVAPFPAAAQEAAGRPITTVETEGLVLLSQETLLFYLGVKTGEPLNEARLDAAIKELWSRKLLDDLQVEAFPDGAGVRLKVKVKERPILRSVEYVGLKRLSRTDIDDRLARESVDTDEGQPLDRGELERLRSVVQEMYQEKGYRFALVEVRYEELDKGEVRATLTVDEGDKVRIGDIDFEGNEVFGDLRLRWVMKKTKEAGPISRFMKKDIYNPANLEEDVKKIKDLYRSAGYKNVLIGEPRIEVVNEGAKRRLAVIVPIDEGERWKFGKITVDGNLKYKAETLLSLAPLRDGGWLRSDEIDKLVEQIKQAYDNSGYIFARVDTELVERDDFVADVLVHVAENDQFRIGRIEFEGNTSTRDKVLRRELRVQEGLFVNLGGVKNSVFKINQLGFFKLDEGDPVKFDANNEKQTVDLGFKGKEDNRTELQFGAGYSDFQGFFGQFSFRTFNFLGRGETVGFSLETGQQRDLFDVSYFIPWFLDRPQSMGFSASRAQTQFTIGNDTYRRSSLGGDVTYGRSFGLFQTASLRYNRARFEDEIRSRSAEGQLTTQEFSRDNSSLQPYWNYNSVDNRFEPTRGQRIRASFEFAGGPLGGSNYFIRPEVAYTIFKPITHYPLRTVVGLNIEAGYIDPFGTIKNAQGVEVDRTLSPLERYFLGGENSVRGHRYRSIAVRDSRGNLVVDPEFSSLSGVNLGGNKYLQVNAEYHVLLGGPFRVIFYVDGGNVYGAFDELVDPTQPNGPKRRVSQNYDFSTLRWTTGAELRILLPVFGAPLRFIYAYNLDEQETDLFDSFRFSIGAAF